MPNIDELNDDLYNKGLVFINGIRDIIKSNGISFKLVLSILIDLMRLAESIINVPKSGDIKHATVMALWNKANKEYKLSEGLSSVLGGIKVKWWIFSIDLSKYTVLIIDKIIIPVIVIVLNKVGGWL